MTQCQLARLAICTVIGKRGPNSGREGRELSRRLREMSQRGVRFGPTGHRRPIGFLPRCDRQFTLGRLARVREGALCRPGVCCRWLLSASASEIRQPWGGRRCTARLRGRMDQAVQKAPKQDRRLEQLRSDQRTHIESYARADAGNSAAKRAKSATWPACRQESALRRIPDLVRDVRSPLIIELL